MANKIFALVGPHASGKTTLIHKLVDIGVNYIPVYTTRRNFSAQDNSRSLLRGVSRENFFKKDFLVHSTYKGEYYGLLKEDVLGSMKEHAINITMLDKDCAHQLGRLVRKNLVTIYLMTDYVTLVERMVMLRHTNDEIKYELKYANDNKEFEYYKTAEYVIKNTHGVDTALLQLLAIMGLSKPIPMKEYHDQTK